VLLPCARATSRIRPAAALPAPRIPQLEPPANLLIVEDEESLRLPISKLLRRKGFRVIEAADGPTAIELLRNNDTWIDAMLLDLTLPGMSGDGVLAEAVRIRPDIKVILTSAYSSQAAGVITARQVKGFIRKPYEFRELTRVLREVLAGSPAEFIRTASS
jgi:DNA-binding response OmpR family regulator